MKSRRIEGFEKKYESWQYQPSWRLSLLSNKGREAWPGLAPLAFQKLKWVDEKLSKVNKANKFRAGNVQNGKL